jgi:Uncharacterized protein SCO1/SenC/PrrC, involved in biogenesis of respiratory and photosynthetic systems
MLFVRDGDSLVWRPHLIVANVSDRNPLSDQSHTPRSTLTITVVFVIIAAVAAAAMLLRPRKFELHHGVLLPTPRTLPAFQLQDLSGGTFTNTQLQGHWTAAFAGYSNCPDVCPTTLSALAQAVHRLSPKKRRELQVLFISVDPKRDSPQRLRRYLHAFDPAFEGATGDLATLRKLGRAMGYAFSYEKPDAGGNYVVNHSAAVMLIDPSGRLAGFLSPPFVPRTLAANLRKVVESSR